MKTGRTRREGMGLMGAAMDEKWLHAPTEDYGPSYSSLENYARLQKPAPVPEGWTPPQPPAAIKR